jgi:hypothetical protein
MVNIIWSATQGDYFWKSAQKNSRYIIKFPHDREQQVGTTEPAYSSKSNLSVSQESIIASLLIWQTRFNTYTSKFSIFSLITSIYVYLYAALLLKKCVLKFLASAIVSMRSSLFWDFMQWRTSFMGCPKMLVTNYQYTLRKIPEQWRSHALQNSIQYFQQKHF